MTISILTGENIFYSHLDPIHEADISYYQLALSLYEEDILTEAAASGWKVSTAHYDSAHQEALSKHKPNSPEAHNVHKDHKFVGKLVDHIKKHGPDHNHIQRTLGVKSKPSGQHRDGDERHDPASKAVRQVGMHHTHVVHKVSDEHKKRGAAASSDRAVHYVVNHAKKTVHVMGIDKKQKAGDYVHHAITAIKHGLHKKD